MNYRWIIKQVIQEDVENLSKALGLHKIIASILVGRGLCKPQEALEFLCPKFSGLHHPHLFYEMKKAAVRVVQAIHKQEHIYLYGDYDVDGVTSISLLYQCLKLLGAKVSYYIPNRMSEGYGLNIPAIQKMAEEKVNLIITVDCGISATSAVAEANMLGIEVIITDHHEPGETLPEAFAIVNPKDYRGNYPFKGIAGVGVAFKLAWAVFQELSEEPNKVEPEYRQFLMDSLALVALGTISDVAPLINENRIIAKVGLNALENSNKIGIKALKEVSNLIQTSPLTAEHVGFRLGPRLNAMGRLEDSFSCVELLISDNPDIAMKLARKLEVQNQKRKTIQEKIYQQAKELIVNHKLENNGVFVLAHEDWHPGVVGIVASRLLEEFYRPILMIALNEEGEGRGSARSIHGFHLFQALQEAEKYLISYGGHEMAAGFRVRKEKIVELDIFLNERAKNLLKAEHLQPNLIADVVIRLNDIDWPLVEQMDKLAPFGEGNHEPLLACYNAEIVKNPAPERYGSQGEHLGFRVRQDGKILRAIAFGQGKNYEALLTNSTCNILFAPKKNTWANMDYIQLHVKDIQFV